MKLTALQKERRAHESAEEKERRCGVRSYNYRKNTDIYNEHLYKYMMSEKYEKWLASYERPETWARNAKLEEKIKKTDLYWGNELEKIMSQLDVVKFKRAF